MDKFKINISDTMIAMIETLDNVFNGANNGDKPRYGVVLLVAPHERSGLVSVISNGVPPSAAMEMFRTQIRQYDEKRAKKKMMN